ELMDGNILKTKPGEPGRKDIDHKVPDPVTRGNWQALKGRLNIRVDTLGVQVAHGQKQIVAGPLQPGATPPKTDVRQAQRIDDHMTVISNLSESDAVVMNQVRAGAQARGIKDPMLLTADGKSIPGMKMNGVNARLVQLTPPAPPAKANLPPGGRLPSSR